MLSVLRIFTPSDFPVLSLGVQAAMPVANRADQSQFRILVSHFLDRFFHNELVSSDEDAKKRMLQVVYAIALPELVVALFLSPSYHGPLPRPYWSQVSDHYFFVLYSFVALGVVSIFAWDLIFPDLLDFLVLTPLSIPPARVFRARILSAGIVLGLFLLATGALGAVFYPLLAEPPRFWRHVAAHLVGVLSGGAFAAGATLALQGILVSVLGERLFRVIAPLLHVFAVTALLAMLLLFPVVSRFLKPLSDLPAAHLFPPFWFLGIYETLLPGAPAAAFRNLAHTGWLALAIAAALVAVSYPIAYGRKMHSLVEASGARSRDGRDVLLMHGVLHATVLRNRVSRGIYHFISQSFFCTQRHRTYLSMYAGLGLALLVATTVLLELSPGHLHLRLSVNGLRASIPIVAFWTIAGLRMAFVSAADRRGAWMFRVLLGRPGVIQLQPAALWVLCCSLVLSLATLVLTTLLAPQQLAGWPPVLNQAVIAVGLCLLLTDIFLLPVRSIPFTGGGISSQTNLALILLQYLGLFPTFVWLTVSLELWLEAGWWHTGIGLLAIAASHILLRQLHRKNVDYYSQLIDLDEDEEEFPQRLGLRYPA